MCKSSVGASRRPAARAGAKRNAYRVIAATIVTTIGFGWLLPSSKIAASAGSLVVWHSPTHDCCIRWVSYMERKGYRVTVNHVSDMAAVKDGFGVPAALRSCHTATFGDYLVEGHVVAKAVAKLFDEHPDLQGIALPGMPAGPPGMGGTPGLYRILAFSADGRTSRFADLGI
jgi:hypothetical protein